MLCQQIAVCFCGDDSGGGCVCVCVCVCVFIQQLVENEKEVFNGEVFLDNVRTKYHFMSQEQS